MFIDIVNYWRDVFYFKYLFRLVFLEEGKMTADNPLSNIGKISEPATRLIEKVSDAIGGVFKPWQIRRVAEAEADAEKVKALAQIKITSLQKRALRRFINEESKRQYNIETITKKALPQIADNAKPQNMEDDWISNFFDKSRLISDDEMQFLWAKVLAGEANNPGTYSKRTVNFLSTLDKLDAIMFQSMCGFCCVFYDTNALIYDITAEIYNNNGINFNEIIHLDEIGLISFNPVGSYKITKLRKNIRLSYFGEPVDLVFNNENNNELITGKVLLSKIGQELVGVCNAKPIPGFLDYAINKWSKSGVTVSKPGKITN